MTTEVAVAIITSIFTLAGVILTVYFGNQKTLYRIEQLEKKQDKHNTLIERMYKCEERLDVAEERMKVANHRLSDLEKHE